VLCERSQVSLAGELMTGFMNARLALPRKLVGAVEGGGRDVSSEGRAEDPGYGDVGWLAGAGGVWASSMGKSALSAQTTAHSPTARFGRLDDVWGSSSPSSSSTGSGSSSPEAVMSTTHRGSGSSANRILSRPARGELQREDSVENELLWADGPLEAVTAREQDAALDGARSRVVA
jgi:hypothetical protein